ncbi:hypothetical protein ACP70R_002568 [Stipagrostis hirtigluma subsp. patula]
MDATAAGDGGDASEPWWRRKRPRPPPPPPEADVEAVKAEALELMAALPVLPRLVVFDLDHTLWPFQWELAEIDLSNSDVGLGLQPKLATTQGYAATVFLRSVWFWLSPAHHYSVLLFAELLNLLTRSSWIQSFVKVIPKVTMSTESLGEELLAYGSTYPQILSQLFYYMHSMFDRLPKDKIPYLYPQARGILKALKEKGVEMAIASRASRRGVAKTFMEKLGIHFMFGAQEIFYTWSPKGDHFQNIRRKTGVPYQSMLFFDDEIRNVIATTKLGVCCVRVEEGITLQKLGIGLSSFAKTSTAPKAEQIRMGLGSFVKTSAAQKADQKES